MQPDRNNDDALQELLRLLQPGLAPRAVPQQPQQQPYQAAQHVRLNQPNVAFDPQLQLAAPVAVAPAGVPDQQTQAFMAILQAMTQPTPPSQPPHASIRFAQMPSAQNAGMNLNAQAYNAGMNLNAQGIHLNAQIAAPPAVTLNAALSHNVPHDAGINMLQAMGLDSQTINWIMSQQTRQAQQNQLTNSLHPAQLPSMHPLAAAELTSDQRDLFAILHEAMSQPTTTHSPGIQQAHAGQAIAFPQVAYLAPPMASLNQQVPNPPALQGPTLPQDPSDQNDDNSSTSSPQEDSKPPAVDRPGQQGEVEVAQQNAQNEGIVDRGYVGAGDQARAENRPNDVMATLDFMPPSFPVKLFRMIVDAERKHLTHIIHFNGAGDAFLLHDRKALMAEVVPNHLRLKNFSSFRRQLCLYGFQKRHFRESLEYRHELFHRDRPLELSYLLRRDSRRTNRPVPPPVASISMQRKLDKK